MIMVLSYIYNIYIYINTLNSVVVFLYSKALLYFALRDLKGLLS